MIVGFLGVIFVVVVSLFVFIVGFVCLGFFCFCGFFFFLVASIHRQKTGSPIVLKSNSAF